MFISFLSAPFPYIIGLNNNNLDHIIKYINKQNNLSIIIYNLENNKFYDQNDQNDNVQDKKKFKKNFYLKSLN